MAIQLAILSNHTQAQIDQSGPISKIRYYVRVYRQQQGLDYLLGHTNKTAFDSNADWVPASGLRKVFSGDVTDMLPAANHWMEIALTIPLITTIPITCSLRFINPPQIMILSWELSATAAIPASITATTAPIPIPAHHPRQMEEAAISAASSLSFRILWCLMHLCLYSLKMVRGCMPVIL